MKRRTHGRIPLTMENSRHQIPSHWLSCERLLEERAVADSAFELYQKGRAGDRDAIGELLNRYGPEVRNRLEGSIAARWRSLLSVDEALQETYYNALRDFSGHQWHGERAFVGWLCKLANSALVDLVRKLGRKMRGGDRVRVSPNQDSESYSALFDLLGGVSTTPSREAAAAEARRIVLEALPQLKERYRLVIQLYDLEGIPAAEVAATLGCEIGAMYQLRKRALARLAQILGTKSKFF
jgi:RNA polymerase sigma factor (sigma-70 family)